MNSKYYRCTFLAKMINHMKKASLPACLRIGRVYLLHDNASSHKTKEVRDYVAEQKVKVLLYHP